MRTICCSGFSCFASKGASRQDVQSVEGGGATLGGATMSSSPKRYMMQKVVKLLSSDMTCLEMLRLERRLKGRWNILSAPEEKEFLQRLLFCRSSRPTCSRPKTHCDTSSLLLHLTNCGIYVRRSRLSNNYGRRLRWRTGSTDIRLCRRRAIDPCF